MSSPLDRRVVAVVGLVIVVVAGALGLTGGFGLLSGTTATPSPSGVAGATATPSPTGTATGTPTASPSPSPTPTPIPTPVLVPDPLTGEPVTQAVANRHPIAVMIDDLIDARPQSGLSSASVVWQAPAEGGIPRYMAIFGPTLPKAIGPVRSSRYYYIAWAAEWRALYAHAGGSPQALATLRTQGAGQLVYNADEFRWGGFFHRITTRLAPHNLYTEGNTLRRLAGQIGAADGTIKPIWSFAPDAPLEARPTGGSITVVYPQNTIRYAYDQATNTYLRSVTGEPKETDQATGTRIAPKNVIVMIMSFGPLNDGEPQKHRLEAKVVGSGKAWISTDGVTIVGTWKKTSLLGPTRFYDSAGNLVTLTIGQTFVQVIANSTNYSATFKAGTPPTGLPPSPSPSGSTTP